MSIKRAFPLFDQNLVFDANAFQRIKTTYSENLSFQSQVFPKKLQKFNPIFLILAKTAHFPFSFEAQMFRLGYSYALNLIGLENKLLTEKSGK